MELIDHEKTIADVFEGLERLNILAKPNHLCCTSCASNDLYHEVKGSEGKYTGYAFYHEQDDDAVRDAKEGEGVLYIGYGALAESNRAAESVGRKIKKELVDAGLTIDWNGDGDTKIKVTRVFFAPHETCDEPDEPKREVLEADDPRRKPDWESPCIVCDAVPTLPLTEMCGPCTWGDSSTAGGNW